MFDWSDIVLNFGVRCTFQHNNNVIKYIYVLFAMCGLKIMYIIDVCMNNM